MELWLSSFQASVALDLVVIVIAWALSSVVLAAVIRWKENRLPKDWIPKEVRTADVAAVTATLGVVVALVAACIAIDNDPLLKAPNVPLFVALVSGGSVITLVVALMLRWELRDITAALHDE